MTDLLATIASYIPPTLIRKILGGEAPAQPTSQRFPAAILFVDVSGFTPLTEALVQMGPEGPEELTRLLNSYFSRMIDLLAAQGGEVVKFSGDALTVLFPATEETLGHATRRAWQAAETMQRAMEEFALLGSPVGTVSLEMKIGIGSGEVIDMQVGGVLDRWEYLIAGDPIRQAAEAEGQAKRGEIVLSPEAADIMCPEVLPPRPLQQPDWSTVLDPAAVENRLRCYVPGPARPWLDEGLREWLGVLRPMSVLFVGVSGLDYSQATAVEQLHSFLRTVQETTYRYEGTLRQLVVDDKGTVLIVVFGAPPFAHADDAARAVHCALDLAGVQLGASTAPQSPPLQLSIGIASGRVFAGPVGSEARREYAVVGDTVNLAARLMSEAGPGAILCDFATYRQARSRVGFESLPPIRVKGKAGPIRIYWPIGREQVKPGAYSILIGRQAEVAHLRDALDTVESGESRVLILSGEAGIGKSRLVTELTRLLRERGLSWLLGAGQSMGRQTPYQAWREIFSYYFDLDEVADPMERRQRVQRLIQEFAPEQLPRLPLLNDILNLEVPETRKTASLDPALRQQSLFLLLLALLRAWARERPLILVLEDAHWLDSLSWELAVYLARALTLSGDPLLLLLVTRPLEEGSPSARYVATLSELPETELLPLPALRPKEAVTLAATCLGLPKGRLPEPLADLVQKRSGGNPFFAEELVFTLRDQGIIAVEPDPVDEGRVAGRPYRCVIHSDLTEAAQALPDTVQGLVLARIDRLIPGCQLALKVAAVIGPVFGYTPLRHTLELHTQIHEMDLRTHLDTLTSLELTWLNSPEPDLVYSFKHLIIQEVAYGTLLFAQRRQLHRTVAEWYENTFGVERDSDGKVQEPFPLSLSPYLPLLVHHYHYAEVPEYERYYARLAGEQAAAQFANTEAVTCLSRALDLAPLDDCDERYALLLAREQVYDRQGARESQHQDLTILQGLAERLDDVKPQATQSRQAEVALRWAHLAEVTGDYSAAASAAQEAIRLAQASGAKIGEAAGYLQWGRSLWRQGEHEMAQIRMEQALNLSREAGVPQETPAELGSAPSSTEAPGEPIRAQAVEADSLRNLGNVSLYLGEYAIARDYYEQALKLSREIGDPSRESALLNNLGSVSANEGDYAGAQTYYEQTLGIKQEIGDRQSQGLALNNLGSTATNLGYYSRARNYFEQALDVYREVDHRRGEGTTLNNLGVVSMGQGDYDKAREYLLQALLRRRELGDRQGECHTLNNLGIVSVYLGDYAHARAYLKKALHLCRAIGNRRAEGEALAYIGLLSHCLGNNTSAHTYGEQALQIAKDLGAHHLQGYALTFLGHTLIGQGHLDGAAQVYQQALDVRRALGQRNLAIGPLAGLAHVALAQGDADRALLHVEEILDYLMTSSLDGIDEPFRVYLTCVQVLRANQDPRAWEVLLTAYHLLQGQAARITDENLRRSFLEIVSAHREIRQAFSETGQDPPGRRSPTSA